MPAGSSLILLGWSIILWLANEGRQYTSIHQDISTGQFVLKLRLKGFFCSKVVVRNSEFFLKFKTR